MVSSLNWHHSAMIEVITYNQKGEDQMQTTAIGIDIAKNIFHVVCCNANNKILHKKAVKRRDLLNYLSNIPCSLVAMEACSSSNYWGREITSLGHEVKLLPAQYVKVFLTGNKNDYNDAHAIVIASQQSHIKTVQVKTIEQQDNQLVHKVRELATSQRTALCNQIRGLLMEYGIYVRLGVNNLRKRVIELLDDLSGLTPVLKQMLALLYGQLDVATRFHNEAGPLLSEKFGPH